jgi:threonylcarbamoyladenosine tRNA methylthiotransferase MtaB
MHICLQSGSENVLKRMKRMYSAAEFSKLIKSIKLNYPSFNITTDIIVGFPGETEEEFNETLEMMNDMEFGHVHTFKYSLRKNTRAEKLADHLPDTIKSQRSEKVRKLAEVHRLKYRRQFVGKQQTVLIEKVDGVWAFGHGENYVPVKIKNNKLKRNRFYKVSIVEVDTNGDEPVLIAGA